MKIDNVEEPIMAVRISQYPNDNKKEFLLIGRSNVGKSSFINTICSRKSLARVSSNPGKTQTINFYLINNNFYIVDAPGYGYANVSKQQQKKFGLMIEEYLVNRPNLAHVFMLVDFRHRPSEDDKLMYNFLKYYNLKVTIVATKYDKVKKSARAKEEKLIEESMDLKENDNLVFFSSVSKKGKESIYNIIKENIAS